MTSSQEKFWYFAELKGIWISITYIPGWLNTDSDKGSRVFNANTKWALSQCIFHKIVYHFRSFGPFIRDLFASRLNFKIKPYVSWGQDPFVYMWTLSPCNGIHHMHSMLTLLSASFHEYSRKSTMTRLL